MDKEQLSQFKEEAKKEIKTKKLSLKKIRVLFNKRNLVMLVIIAAIIGGAIALKVFVFKPLPKKIYEVAVQVRSQVKPDPTEDRKNSLKAGDVLLAVDEGHKWSQTEKVSYLILKMSLTEIEVAKLTDPEEIELDFDDLSEEEQARIEEEKKMAKEEGREYVEEPHRETVRMRQYYIPLDQEEFAGFKPVDLLKGQPYSDKVYDWGIVEKKKSVK